ncbi:MAG TPA: ABC transporter ATP-binding protein [bacterium]|nr:ABC transporter ATP-binding protein [bacterium]
MTPFVRTSDLFKTYQKGTVPIPVLRGVSLEMEKGQYVSIVGRSGSGKSTLLNLLGGLDTATSGHIVVGDSEVTSMSRSELAVHRRSTVGMIFQSFNLIPSRTALENITLALAFGSHPRSDRRRRATELLTSVGLEHRLRHTPGELSGGEAQRVAIARALSNDPDVLLADEPTGNLDSRTAKEIVELLVALNRERGLTVVMVSHDEEAAREVSHRVFRLLDGRVVDELSGRSGA